MDIQSFCRTVSLFTSLLQDDFLVPRCQHRNSPKSMKGFVMFCLYDMFLIYCLLVFSFLIYLFFYLF